MGDTQKVDALLIPRGWNPPGHVQGADRRDEIFNFAEALLPGKAWIRDIGDGATKFITSDPHDSLLFPNGHRLARRPRYDWVNMPDGSQHGYFCAEAKADQARAHETPDQTAAREADVEKLEAQYLEQMKVGKRWLELKNLGDNRTAEQNAEFWSLTVQLGGKAPAPANKS